MYHLTRTAFKVRRKQAGRERRTKDQVETTMKTTSGTCMLIATLTIALATAASAAPPGKQTTSRKPAVSADGSKANANVDHHAMKRVGPPGKGHRCSH